MSRGADIQKRKLGEALHPNRDCVQCPLIRVEAEPRGNRNLKRRRTGPQIPSRLRKNHERKPVVRYFLGVADPIHYVAQISPRRVYFQNGEHDVLVPAAAGRALQEAAQEPKKITWYDSDHVGINLEHTKRVLEDGLEWLLQQDDPFRAPDERIRDVPAFEIKKT
jgi:fermentation-respiration switch protein FrsA (DUF1100 family)